MNVNPKLDSEGDVEYMTHEGAIRDLLPFRLKDGHGVNVRIPVFETYNDESTLGPKPATSSGPVFEVKVNVQRDEAGDQTHWGLWNPDDDEEYLGHGVSAGGAGYSRYDHSRVSVNIEEWLNEVLEERPEALEGYIEEAQ